MKLRKIVITTSFLLNIVMLSCGSSQEVYNIDQSNSSQETINEFQITNK